MNWVLCRGIRYHRRFQDETNLGAFGGDVLYLIRWCWTDVVLQQSLALASVLSLGHLGTKELGGNRPSP